MREEVVKAFKNGDKHQIAEALKHYYKEKGAGRQNSINVQSMLDYEAKVDEIFNITS